MLEEILKEYTEKERVKDKEISSEHIMKFSGECEAMYFAALRANMRSDVAHMVMQKPM